MSLSSPVRLHGAKCVSHACTGAVDDVPGHPGVRGQQFVAGVVGVPTEAMVDMDEFPVGFKRGQRRFGHAPSGCKAVKKARVSTLLCS